MTKKCKCGRSYLTYRQTACFSCRRERYYINGKYVKAKNKKTENTIKINQQMSIKQVKNFIKKNKPFVIIFHFENEKGKRYIKKYNQEIEVSQLLYDKFRKFDHEKIKVDFYEFRMIFNK